MATVQLGIRLDEKEKQELERNAKALGLNAATAVKMLISQFNYDKGFSVPINRKASLDTPAKLPKSIEKAMLLAAAEEAGVVNDESIEVTDLDAWRQRWTD